MKSLDASLISAKMFLNAAHPSSLELPAGMIMVLRFLLTEASDTCTNMFIRAANLEDVINLTEPQRVDNKSEDMKHFNFSFVFLPPFG